MIHLVGASLAVPVQEELFFHLRLYRYMLKRLHPQGCDSFASVLFSAWNWAVWIALNAIKGVYNGKEWQSYFINGLLFQWMIGRHRLFLDGLLMHAVSNLTIGYWVLSTNQRQYW
jgi:membrane protease YdiL (CAAX protease family)